MAFLMKVYMAGCVFLVVQLSFILDSSWYIKEGSSFRIESENRKSLLLAGKLIFKYKGIYKLVKVSTNNGMHYITEVMFSSAN